LALVIRFGAFELDPTAGELRRAGKLLPLTGQPLRVLITLAEHAGEIVTREELQREIWGDDTHVDFDAGLSTCVNQIRSALGDRASSPRFIETLPRRGYRFVAPVVRLKADATEAHPGASGFSRTGWIAVAAMMAAVAVFLFSIRARPSLAPIPIVVTPVTVDATRSDLGPVSISLTDAVIGSLVREAGARARVASPVAVAHLRGRDASLDELRDLGAEYFVTVSLRSLGGPVLVHAKLAHISGWILWTSDDEMTLDQLERGQLAIAGDLAKRVASEILPSAKARRAPLANAVGDYAQAVADLDNGRLAESLAGFEKVLALDPHHPGSLAGLAEATIDAVAAGLLDRKHGRETAIRHARRALDLDPVNARALDVLKTASN
jgi:DNA-binding winged helix-turn-helix (wHTH) protein/TolB-like protein